MEKKEIFAAAWEKWHDLQFLMVIEECAELQQAIIKVKRGYPILAVAEEVADVELMLEQLRALSPELNNEIDRYKILKLRRLEKMLKVK